MKTKTSSKYISLIPLISGDRKARRFYEKHFSNAESKPPVSPLPVKPFRFHPSLTSAQRDGVALTLRKLGHYCYQEVGFGGEILYTNCPASEIPIATGLGFVLSPIN